MATTIKVYSPCSCESCVAGKRWFYCQDLNLIAEYDVAPFDDMEGVPHPQAVAEVERANPGARLVYMHYGAYYETLIEKYRRELAAQSANPALNSAGH